MTLTRDKIIEAAREAGYPSALEIEKAKVRELVELLAQEQSKMQCESYSPKLDDEINAAIAKHGGEA
jgi:hypothetical protein